MSFLSRVDQTKTEFEAGSGFSVIPEKTRVLATIDEIKAEEDRFSSGSYVSARWSVARPEQYANQKIFQKIRLWDADTAKAATHSQMLAAIATNAGGQLFKMMQEKGETEPSNETLQVLLHRPMVLELAVWKIEAKDSQDGQERSGNWVRAVSPAKNAPQIQQQAVPVPAPKPDNIDFGDDVPF